MMTTEDRATWLASGSHFFTHSFMSLLPVVLVAITSEHSISFLDLGIIANLGYFLYGFGGFPAGVLADRYGSKNVLTIGVAGMGLASILVGVLPGAWGFTLSYAILGAFASIHHPAGLSLIARRVKVKGRAMAIHGVLGNVGLVFAPLAAGVTTMAFRSWRASYLLYGVAGVIFAFFFHRTRIEGERDFSRRSFSRQAEAGEKIVAENEEQTVQNDQPPQERSYPLVLLVLFFGSILSGLIFRGSLTYFPLLLQREVHFITSHDEPVMIAGVIASAILSFGILGAWIGGWINDKIKIPEFMPIALFCVVGPALYFMSRWTDMRLIAVSCVFSLFYYAWQPSQNYLIAKYAANASQGKNFGVSFFLLFGMGSTAAAIGGYVSDHFGVDSFYLVMAWICCFSLMASVAVLRVRSYFLRFSWRIVKG